MFYLLPDVVRRTYCHGRGEFFAKKYFQGLLPDGSEEKGVLGVGNIPMAIHRNYNCKKMYVYSWVVKIRNTSETVLSWPQYISLPSY